jgi:DNA replicative helicase MCM subunit Mcm2 (Cdc46/Mcm family)
MNKTTLPQDTFFYCKDCRAIVTAQKAGRKHVYKCNECNTKNVAFGTEDSIKGFYRIKDAGTITKKIPTEEEKL